MAIKAKVYHTGWYVKKTYKGNIAVFQFRHSIDFLSCELIEYTGQRETTIKDALKRLRENKKLVLNELNNKYPNYKLKNVVIE